MIFSRWLTWTTRDGRQVDFKMPARAHGLLSDRLAGLVRDREVTRSEAAAANRLAAALTLCHGRRPTFCVCRRGLAGIAALGLSEWLCRRAREVLEAVGFLERVPTFVRWSSRTRRRPTLFRLGLEFASRIQAKRTTPTIEKAPSVIGRGLHLGGGARRQMIFGHEPLRSATTPPLCPSPGSIGPSRTGPSASRPHSVGARSSGV